MPSHDEWLKQAQYDIETAECMLETGRNVYAVFMCHLSVEKALKGLYSRKLAQLPPRTHNLVVLLREMDLVPPEKIAKWIIGLNEAHIVTRYPEDLAKAQAAYSTTVANEILQATVSTLTWIKAQL